jgi:hypothetical protein
VPDSADDNDPIEAAWHALIDSQWDDEEKHRAFVGLAAALSRLPDAAAHYRAVESDPSRRERAEFGKQLVLKNAMALLSSMPRTTLDDAKKRARWIVPLATLGVFLAMDFALAALLHQPKFLSIPAFVLEILIVVLLPWRRLLS